MPRVKRIGWLIIILGSLLVIVWAVRLVGTALALQKHLAQVQTLARDPKPGNLTTACDLAQSIRRDVLVLNENSGLVGLLADLGWLPGVGGDLQAAPSLLKVAVGLSETASVTCAGLTPVLAGADAAGGTWSMQRAIGLLADNQAVLQQALHGVEQAQKAWAAVDAARLSPRVASKTALLERGLPLLHTGLAAAALAPDLLGLTQPRTYLILALNEDELRPGGGFISGVGEVRLDAGQVVTMTFRDGYAPDDYSLPYPDPPEPLRRYMGLDLWVFRDSNWSPDFPTSARQGLALYRPGHPVAIDGVIALDQQAVQGLIGALGSVTLPGAQEPITGDTLIPYIRHAYDPAGGAINGDWWLQRKSFMGPLAKAALGRIQAGQANWGTLAQTVLSLLDGKHLLVYLTAPAEARVMAEQGWDGALAREPGDFLMVVGANVGYNKASARVQQKVTYRVDLRPENPQAQLTLAFHHTGTVAYPCIGESTYDTTYEKMMDRCYWDYVRVYVPEGSQLIDATRQPLPASAFDTKIEEPGNVIASPAPEGPWLSLAGLSLVPAGGDSTRTYTLTLPAAVVQWAGNEGTYRLHLQKQAGVPSYPVTVSVRLPEASTLLQAVPAPSSTEDQWLSFSFDMTRDRKLQIRWRGKK